MGELVGQGAAHLHGGAFAADRGAEQVRDHRAAQHQRRHAQRDDLLRVVDLVDQQVVAGLDLLAEAQVEPADREAGQRQQPDQPAVLRAGGGRPVEGKEEER
ncbi:hypothetical protein D3C78_1651350 [compost metagenome]